MLASSRTASELLAYTPLRRDRGLLLVLGTALLLLLHLTAAHAGNITIKDARTAIVNDIVHLDLDLGFEFNSDVIEALRNGIAIEIAIDVEFNRPRWYWLNAEVARGKHRFRISFLPLSEQYLLTNVVTGDRQTLPTFDDVITALGTLRSLPLAEVGNFKVGRKYRCAVQVQLDIEALPAPMRPLAYFSRAWRMASDWFEWDFQL